MRIMKLKHPKVQWGGGTIADSTLHNRLFYQLSTFTKAFTDLMTDNSIDATDEDISVLKR